MSATSTFSLTLPAAGKRLRFSSDDCFPSSVSFLRQKSVFQCRASVRSFTTDTASAMMDSRRTASASLYEVLRVDQSASPEEIKLAYRNLAKLYHPDTAMNRSESDGRDFIEIHNAYATLSDPSARALYDLSLMAHQRRRLSSYAAGIQTDPSFGFYPTQRWETDQCW
ncbi:hypothetical protein L6164_030947 [Bauhinia variegata]|uniref:Uncharacterized protein n=1 Tax=Bauhinia variegata TaxID=167791 RepID=A0ACB9LDG8_BAUVA|nr:hypothetical protein L6164_030947 [Bauhinia variegata]